MPCVAGGTSSRLATCDPVATSADNALVSLPALNPNAWPPQDQIGVERRDDT